MLQTIKENFFLVPLTPKFVLQISRDIKLSVNFVKNFSGNLKFPCDFLL